MILPEINEADLPSLMAASYRNFHARGLDYICLKRTPEHTIKVYFLNGDVSKVPEVVNPHDHRYAFRTKVLAGAMADHRFISNRHGSVFAAFDYMTPLNGGNGFTYRGEERLTKVSSINLGRGDELSTVAVHRHTIQMLEDQTVLLLEQFEDEVPLDQPTSTWVRKGYPKPDMSGLYDRFTENQFFDRIRTLTGLLEDFNAKAA